MMDMAFWSFLIISQIYEASNHKNKEGYRMIYLSLATMVFIIEIIKRLS